MRIVIRILLSAASASFHRPPSFELSLEGTPSGVDDKRKAGQISKGADDGRERDAGGEVLDNGDFTTWTPENWHLCSRELDLSSRALYSTENYGPHAYCEKEFQLCNATIASSSGASMAETSWMLMQSSRPAAMTSDLNHSRGVPPPLHKAPAQNLISRDGRKHVQLIPWVHNSNKDSTRHRGECKLWFNFCWISLCALLAFNELLSLIHAHLKFIKHINFSKCIRFHQLP